MWNSFWKCKYVLQANFIYSWIISSSLTTYWAFEEVKLKIAEVQYLFVKHFKILNIGSFLQLFCCTIKKITFQITSLFFWKILKTNNKPAWKVNNSCPLIESGGHSVSRGRDWVLECCRRIGDYKGETENRPRQNTTRGQVNHHILSKVEADFNQGYIFFPTNPRGVCYKIQDFWEKVLFRVEEKCLKIPTFSYFSQSNRKSLTPPLPLVYNH